MCIKRREKKISSTGAIHIYHRAARMGYSRPLGPVMVSASMHDTIIERFRYYYIAIAAQMIETLDCN